MNIYTYRMTTQDSELCDDPGFIDFVRMWASTHITKPIQGFEQKTGSNGGQLSQRELLHETHQQVVQAACYFHKKGKPLNEIITILSFFKK